MMQLFYSIRSLTLLNEFLETAKEKKVAKVAHVFALPSNYSVACSELLLPLEGEDIWKGRAKWVNRDKTVTSYYVWSIQGQEQETKYLKCFRCV